MYVRTFFQEDVIETAPPGSWTLFVTYILEQEGAITSLLEALKDGSPKLQQAYLNILNIVFLERNNQSSPNNNQNNTNNHGQGDAIGDGGGGEINVDKVLYNIREQLACPQTVLPFLLRLIDQGSSSAVRAKALCAAQLLCRHSPHLVKGKKRKFCVLLYGID